MKTIKFILIIFLSYFIINTSYAYDENIVPVANPSGYGYGYNNVLRVKEHLRESFHLKMVRK